jgi:hypothetical protein
MKSTEESQTMTNAQSTAQAIESTADDVPRGYWRNGAGALIPVGKIKPVDKARDELVKRIVQRSQALNAEMAKFKAEVMGDIDAFVALSASEYGVTLRGSLGKGNITLSSFDGRYKLEKAVAERIAFDEGLQIAKKLIDGCVHRWSKGANHNLQALVASAFRVDAAGQVSVGNVLGLRKIEIDDPEWHQAMTAIGNSVQTVASVQYVRVYERNARGGYDPIPLNIATL